jgi:hypothetical protein
MVDAEQRAQHLEREREDKKGAGMQGMMENLVISGIDSHLALVGSPGHPRTTQPNPNTPAIVYFSLLGFTTPLCISFL